MALANPKSLSLTGWYSTDLSGSILEKHGQSHSVVWEDRMIIFLLCFLAAIDSAFIGYREAAGRNALIEKSAYYRHALFRGALFGEAAVLLVGVVTAVALFISGDALGLLFDLDLVGARMLTVYVPYALILLLTFCIRALPSVDMRSITSVLIFGPFTFIRPVVVLVGAIWGVLAAPSPTMIVLVALIVCLMLGLESVLSWLRSRGLLS